MTTTTPELEGLDCPDPFHRLYNLVDKARVREFMEDGSSRPCAVVVAALELPEGLYPTAVRLIHEKGWFGYAPLEELLADPHAVLTAFAGVALEADELNARRGRRGAGRGHGGSKRRKRKP